jgi:hypothetical protein
VSDSALSESALSDTPRATADKKAGETELGAGNSKLVTTLPPVKTKVCLGKIGITGSRVVNPDPQGSALV